MTFKLLMPQELTDPIHVPTDGEIIPYDPKNRIPAEHHDAQAIVLWDGNNAWMRQAAEDLQQLEWVQGLHAGPNMVLDAGFREEAIITSGVGLHDSTVSEHTLALLLTAARSMHPLYEAQKESRWDFDLGGIQHPGGKRKFTEIRGSKIAIWGFGSIARTLAPILRLMQADVFGIATSAREDHGFKVYAATDVPKLLPKIDVLIMLLPAIPETDNVLNKETLALLPEHAWVFNVGRGNSINEDDLVEALKSNTISGAGIDVMKKEPLPKESPLWTAPNIIITPHAAGGRPIGYAKLITENWAKLLNKEPLKNLVNR